jgi:ribosomal-protein-alanine N-acetyltransferase
MASKHEANFLSRWPKLQSLRNAIRRIIPHDSPRPILKMPVLETERLILRPFDRNDIADIMAWGEVPDARSTEAEAREFLDYCFREYREHILGPWGMQWKETGAMIGNCGFPEIDLDTKCGEVNYYVTAAHRGKGVALEALNALLKLGFQEFALARIQARCEANNLNSERVMQKARMKFEKLVDPPAALNDPASKHKLYAIHPETVGPK